MRRRADPPLKKVQSGTPHGERGEKAAGPSGVGLTCERSSCRRYDGLPAQGCHAPIDLSAPGTPKLPPSRVDPRNAKEE